jgi:ankyrin repeat protein
MHAAKKGSLKVLKTLLNLKANVYAQDVRDMTALHHAAFTCKHRYYFSSSLMYQIIIEL